MAAGSKLTGPVFLTGIIPFKKSVVLLFVCLCFVGSVATSYNLLLVF